MWPAGQWCARLIMPTLQAHGEFDKNRFKLFVFHYK